MSWSASLKSANVIDGVATIVITFEDADTKRGFDKTYRIGSPGDDFIGKQSAQEIRNLEALDTWVAKLQMGPIEPFKQPDITPDQVAANDFFANLYKLNTLKDAVDKGLAKIDQDYTDLEIAVKTAFKPEYTTDFRWR